MSNAFEFAQRFFAACEEPLGWDECRQYVAPDATFAAQSEPIANIKTVEEYSQWMHAFGTITTNGASYTLHSKAWDQDNQTALFFATFHGTHVGDGGPIAPTGKSTNSDYVYAIRMNESGQVEHMTKIWNAPWAMHELGWS